MIVSLYGVLGILRLTSAPNLFFNLLTKTSRCVVPIPEITTSAFSISLDIENVGSSSNNFESPLDILSSSPFVLGITALEYTGNGNFILLNTIGLFEAHMVSPVLVNCNFETAPISPAFISVVGYCFFPFIKYRDPSFSSFSLDELNTTVSDFADPVITLNIDSLPMNGSTIVLNTNAENGSFSLIFIFINALFLISLAIYKLVSIGDGKHSTISSNNVSVPILAIAEPHIIGHISPVDDPLINP